MIPPFHLIRWVKLRWREKMRKIHTRVPVGMLPERAPNAWLSSRAQKDLGPFSGRAVEEFNQSS